MHIESIIKEGTKIYGFFADMTKMDNLIGADKQKVLASIKFVLQKLDLKNPAESECNTDQEVTLILKDYANGQQVLRKKVQECFRSINLNVDQQNFLIDQSKMDQVLNMKPNELLSLVEESMNKWKKPAFQREVELKRKLSKLEFNQYELYHTDPEPNADRSQQLSHDENIAIPTMTMGGHEAGQSPDGTANGRLLPWKPNFPHLHGDFEGSKRKKSEVLNLFKFLKKVKKSTKLQLDNKDLEQAFVTINNAFNGMFSILLSGAMARLCPVLTNGRLDGLKIQVGFNKMWLQTRIDDLPFDRKYMVAFCLILAMQKYSPAPFYIVDGVFDLTDFEKMQIVHFSNSQFLFK